MSAVPAVVRVGDTLVAALHEDIDDAAALALAETICDRVAAEAIPAVVLDVSAAHFVDSFICRVVSDIAAMARLLGARVAGRGHAPRGRHHAGGAGVDPRRGRDGQGRR